MSEEEIIKYANIIIKEKRLIHIISLSKTVNAGEITQGLLDLYNKEKEKNKELEYGLYETQESYKLKKRELELNLQNFSKIYISKDKIKEVIKDLEKFDINFYDTETLKECFKNSLKELLEE